MLSVALPHTSKMGLNFFFKLQEPARLLETECFHLWREWTLMVAELAVTLFSFFLDQNLGFAQVSPHS